MSAPDFAVPALCDFAPFRREIAARAVELQLERNPDFSQRHGARGREKCEQDACHHLLFLAEAVSAASPVLFEDYVIWVRSLLSSLSVPTDDLVQQLDALADVLGERSDSQHAELGARYLRDAVENMEQLTDRHALSLVAGPQEQLIDDLLRALLACRRDEAVRLIHSAVERGTTVQTIYIDVFQPLLREIGRLWQLGSVTVAQEHYCTAAVQLLMGQLSIHVFAAERNGRSMLTACVGDELHEVGARMVSDFFEMSGWDTHFLGANVPTQALLAMLRSMRCEVLCLSVTLTSHLGAAREIIAAVRKQRELSGVRVLVGGSPFNVQSDLWRRIGADASAPDAASAVRFAAQLVGH